MTPSEIVTQVVEILTSGIVELAKGIGTGISQAVTSMAYNTTGDGLSVFFIMVLVFAGVALAVGLTRMIYTFLTSLGN